MAGQERKSWHRWLPRVPSLRVRVKPSWKARVIGTFAISPFQLLLTFLFVAGAALLFLYLGYLNLAEIDLSAENAAVQHNLQCYKASVNVDFPKKIDRLNEVARSLFPVSYKIYVITGLAKESIGGLLHDTVESDSLRPLDKLRSDIEYLEKRRFTPLNAHLKEKAEEWEFTPSVIPLLGECRVTSWFGNRRNPFTRKVEFHKALDLSAELNTKIIAPAPGRVIKVQDDARSQFYGKYVIVDHNQYYDTVYAHCSKIFVREGQWVARGQVLAEVGNTGRSTGPHLHYEVRKKADQQNPLFYILDKDLDSDDMLFD